MSKAFTREDAIGLFTEMLDHAIANGQTCSTRAEKIERQRLADRMLADSVKREIELAARAAPIPPYTAIAMSPTSKRTMIKTAPIYEHRSDGFRRVVGGGLEIARGMRLEIPTATADEWRRDDPEFAAAVESGELELTVMTEAEARPIEEHNRRFVQAGETTRQIMAQPSGMGSRTFRG